MIVNEEQQEVAKESVGFVNYKGIAPRIILAVNPNKKELGIIYGREIEGDEPSYVKEIEIDGKMVKQITLKFMGKTIYLPTIGSDEIDVNLNNIFRISNEFAISPDKGTFQAIDEFGQSCWLTKEEFQSKQLPMYSNGPAKIDTATWRPAYKGEVNFVTFLRVLFNTPQLQIWSQTERKFIDNPSLKDEKVLAKAKFWKKEDTEKLLKGDFKELQAAVKKVPNNIVINYFYTETSAENRVFMKMLEDVTLPPNYKLESAIKAFTKRIVTDKNSIVNYYNVHNPDKLKGMSIDYLDKLVKVEIKPTEYKENDSMYVHAEVEDLPETKEDVSELPF